MADRTSDPSRSTLVLRAVLRTTGASEIRIEDERFARELIPRARAAEENWRRFDRAPAVSAFQCLARD